MYGSTSKVLASAFTTCLIAGQPLHAQGVQGTISQEKLGYQVELYGDLVMSSNGLLSGALMQGRGQHLLQERNILVTSEKIAEIVSGKVSLQVKTKRTPDSKNLERLPVQFAILESTKICKNGKPVAVDSLKKGDMVTVTSEPGKINAISVRIGPMLFGGADTGVGKLKRYDCST